jgi:hypothetical protein
MRFFYFRSIEDINRHRADVTSFEFQRRFS